MPQDLFFVALIPPSPLKEEVHELKVYMSEKYESSHALKSPPHITLLSPFSPGEEQREVMEGVLKEKTAALDPVRIQLRDFSSFGTRVLFIDVVRNPELADLQDQLEREARSQQGVFNYNYDHRSFHPHMTLAFKDLSRKHFHEAWDEFSEKNFEAEFLADSISLLKHDGKGWQEIAEFKLGPS